MTTDMVGADVGAARRNLVLISIAFIIFALGDGTIGTPTGNGTSVSLLGGSFHIEKSEVLRIFAWVMFVWFLIRYCQELDFYEAFRSVIADCNTNPQRTAKYVNKIKKMTGDGQPPNRYMIAGKSAAREPSSFNERWDLCRNLTATIAPYTHIEKNEYCLKIKLLSYALIKRSFYVYYFPFVLWLTALIITIYCARINGVGVNL